MPTLALLIPASTGTPTTPPTALPFGRAALRAREHGLDVIFGERGTALGELVGLRATPTGWEEARVAPDAVFDRFRDQTHPERYAAARARLGHLPWGNTPEAIALCRDKWASQQVVAAAVPMPEAVVDDFEAALDEWGQAFLKPRFGSFGRGVRLVRPGDDLPRHGPGMHADDPQPYLLQRAIAPPPGWGGVSVRALVQRVDGQWTCRTPVARCSRDEAVVNVARGASVGPARDLLGDAVDRALRAEATHAAQALAATPGTWLEVGVDLVVDPGGTVFVIEVNGRPRGRLAAVSGLSEALRAEHEQACLQPLLEIGATR